MNPTQPGFYWVNVAHPSQPDDWQPARWDGNDWWLIGEGDPFTLAEIQEVGEAIKAGDMV